MFGCTRTTLAILALAALGASASAYCADLEKLDPVECIDEGLALEMGAAVGGPIESLANQAQKDVQLLERYRASYRSAGAPNFAAPELKKPTELALKKLIELENELRLHPPSEGNRADPRFAPELEKIISSGQAITQKSSPGYLESLMFMKRATLFLTEWGGLPPRFGVYEGNPILSGQG